MDILIVALIGFPATVFVLYLISRLGRKQPFKPGVYGVRFRRLPKYEYVILHLDEPAELVLKEGEHLEYIAPLGFLATEAWLLQNVFPPPSKGAPDEREEAHAQAGS